MSEQLARQILGVFSQRDLLYIGGTLTYAMLAAEISDPINLDAGLRHAVTEIWLRWGPNASHTFTVTEVGLKAVQRVG